MENDKRILEILIKKGIIDDKTAQNVKDASINSGTPLVDILLQKHLVSPDDLFIAKAESLNLPHVTLAGKGISPEILNLIPEPVARKYKLIPFVLEKTSGQLSVAMVDTLDLPLIAFLEQKSGKTLIPYLARDNDIMAKIEEEYSQGLAADVTEALKESSDSGVKTINSTQISNIIKEAPIAKIVSTILEYAIKSRASDVHIEPQETRTRVRYRIDGILNEKLALPSNVHDAVVSRIKILSDLKLDERRIPQAGRFNFKMGDEEVDVC